MTYHLIRKGRKKNIKEHYFCLFKSQSSVIILILIFAALAIWWPSPIYPDELAFRIGNTRYLQNKDDYWGLYPFCNQTPIEISWLFLPSLWILSTFDLAFSPFAFRSVALLAIVACCIEISMYAKSKSQNHLTGLLCIIVVGVAGSGLILARGEHLIILHIFIILYILNRETNYSTYKKIFLLALVIISTTSICQIHPQGLLFIPTSALAVHHLFLSSQRYILIGRCLVVILIIIVSIFFIIGLQKHQFICDSYPTLVSNFQSMVLNIKDLNIVSFPIILIGKANGFINAFLYQTQYQVMYLPGVESSFLSEIVNLLIRLIVILLITTNLILLLYYTGVLIKNFYLTQNIIDTRIIFLSCMLSSIGFFLIIYDMKQYFYRTFFINFLFAISSIIFLSHPNTPKLRILNILIFLTILTCIGSLYLNYKYFHYRLSSWDAIATTPRHYVSRPLKNDIHSAAEACGIDLARGRLIIDGYTYESLKTAKQLIDIYYIRLAMNEKNGDLSSVIRTLGISGVLASCKGMSDSKVGWPPDFSSNKICCSTFK